MQGTARFLTPEELFRQMDERKEAEEDDLASSEFRQVSPLEAQELDDRFTRRLFGRI